MTAETVEFQLRAWFGIRSPKEMKCLILLIPFSLFWNTWKDRNRRAFEGIESLDNSIIEGQARELNFWQTHVHG